MIYNNTARNFLIFYGDTYRQQTQLKDGAQLPPPDQLIHQLVELANSENPPCANCDKRDKSTMFFCTTCGTFYGDIIFRYYVSTLYR